MKTTIISLLLLFVSSSVLFSQNEDYKSTLTLSTGYSIADQKLINENESDSEFTTRLFPLVQVGYDYAFNERLSFGAGVSSQLMYLNYTNYGDDQVDFQKNLVINTFSLRVLVHYGLEAKKINMYSGLRLSAIDYLISTDYQDYDERLTTDLKVSNFVLPHAQLILWGIRAKLSDRFGANMEICVGQPYFVSLGLTYSL